LGERWENKGRGSGLAERSGEWKGSFLRFAGAVYRALVGEFSVRTRMTSFGIWQPGRDSDSLLSPRPVAPRRGKREQREFHRIGNQRADPAKRNGHVTSCQGKGRHRGNLLARREQKTGGVRSEDGSLTIGERGCIKNPKCVKPCQRKKATDLNRLGTAILGTEATLKR